LFKTNYLEDMGLSEMIIDITGETEEDEFFNRALAECGNLITDEPNDDQMDHILSESGSAAAKSIAQEVVKEIKDGKRKGKIDRRKCQKIVSDGIKEYSKETFKGKEMSKSALTTFIVIMINNINNVIFIVLLGEKKGELIADGICAPIVEEVSKFIALKKGYDAQYSVVFNATEWAAYTHAYSAEEGKFSAKAGAFRSGIQYLHVIYMNIQRRFNAKADEMEKEFGGKHAKAEAMRLVGLVLAITLHSMWNISMIIIFKDKDKLKSNLPAVRS